MTYTAERYRQALRTIGGYAEEGKPTCGPEERWPIIAEALLLAIEFAEEPDDDEV